jgi:hypothetical protein
MVVQQNLLYATPILSKSGGPQFTGVKTVSVNGNGGPTGCAIKTDSTLWCWGYNHEGQVGVGTNDDWYDYPVQVTSLFNTVVSVDAGTYATCAVTSDGSVWCWGDNTGGVLGNGLSSGSSNVPLQVLDSLGGQPFTGATQVTFTDPESEVCVRKGADNSIWCWGERWNLGLTPAPLTQNGSAVTGVFYWGSGGCEITGGGELIIVGYNNNETAGPQVPCP